MSVINFFKNPILFILLLPVFTSFAEEKGSKIAFPRAVPLNLRNGPGDFYNVIYILKNKNLPFSINYRIDNWCFIEIDEDYKGWIKCSSALTQKKISFLNKNSFLFRLPGKQKITTLEKNSKIKIIKCGLTWCRVLLYSDRFIGGWINKKDIFGLEN